MVIVYDAALDSIGFACPIMFPGTISVSMGGLVVVFAVNGNHRRQVIVVDLDVVADAKLSIQVRKLKDY